MIVRMLKTENQTLTPNSSKPGIQISIEFIKIDNRVVVLEKDERNRMLRESGFAVLLGVACCEALLTEGLLQRGEFVCISAMVQACSP